VADCCWSPDGKKIALCHGGEVWICTTDGAAPVQLTRTTVIENFPQWSPDGTSIAVIIRSTGQLRILSASDGEVIRTFEKVDQYDWTPDGKEITVAFTAGQLSATSIVSGITRNIANWKTISPEFNQLKCSPDGNWIAFSAFDITDIVLHTHLYLINTADGKATELASDVSGHKGKPIWSPDSKWIAFSLWISTVSNEPKKTGVEGTLWEADVTGFMNKMKPGN
jgi:Tol biopolymer transport system component